MKNIFFCGTVIFLLLGSSLGCSQPLRTLMDLGSEQKAQQNFAKIEATRFNAILRDAKAGRIAKGATREKIIARYGKPVLDTGATFLYRGQVDFFDSPKVYLDFDEKGLLLGTRVVEQERDV